MAMPKHNDNLGIGLLGRTRDYSMFRDCECPHYDNKTPGLCLNLSKEGYACTRLKHEEGLHHAHIKDGKIYCEWE